MRRQWLLGSLVAVGLAWAQVDPAHVAQAVHRSIRLGGDLEQWQGIPQYPVILSNTYPSKPVSHPGYFSVAWDEENLYFLGVFTQEAGTVRAGLPADHPQWWEDDTMEIFLKTAPLDKGSEVIHLAANPRGTRFKAYTYTTDYQTQGRILPDRWILEWAIPFRSLRTKTPTVGEFWNLKVGREHQAAAEYPLWPMGGDYHSPTNFGFLAFVREPQDPGALANGIAQLLGVEAPIKSRLEGLLSYAVYYGTDKEELAKLVNFDLAILQPKWSREDIAYLKANGVKVISYLSLGEVEPNLDYGQPIPEAWILGRNPHWGSQYVDASQPGWQELILELANRYRQSGFDGFFLDTLDTADLFPQVAAGLVALVKGLRDRFPEAILIQNRGFRLLPQTAEYLDAVMYESFSTTYDFKGQRYLAFDGDPGVVLPYAKRGLVVLALDYASPTDAALVERAFVRAREFGFIPYVSTILLDRVYLQNP